MVLLCNLLQQQMHLLARRCSSSHDSSQSRAALTNQQRCTKKKCWVSQLSATRPGCAETIGKQMIDMEQQQAASHSWGPRVRVPHIHFCYCSLLQQYTAHQQHVRVGGVAVQYATPTKLAYPPIYVRLMPHLHDHTHQLIRSAPAPPYMDHPRTPGSPPT